MIPCGVCQIKSKRALVSAGTRYANIIKSLRYFPLIANLIYARGIIFRLLETTRSADNRDRDIRNLPRDRSIIEREGSERVSSLVGYISLASAREF
jgi:hypothetical protein